MSVASDLIDRAERSGVQVERAGNKLKIRAKRKPSDDIRDDLRAHKAELLAFLSEDCWTGQNEERAAIVEYDGQVSRVWAEGLARLDPSRPPRHVHPPQWRQFCDDCGRFCDEWASRANHLGWTPLALFGCDQERPFARDRAGLLWLVEGHRVIALSSDTAMLEAEAGSPFRYKHARYLKANGTAVWVLDDL